MPLPSIFSGVPGQMRFSSGPCTAEKVYETLAAPKRGSFDLGATTYEEMKTYAQAMGIARVLDATERAQNQLNPFLCVELLPVLEHDWGVVPSLDATRLERQQALAAQMAISRGARREHVEAGLKAILGDDFIALRVLTAAEATFHSPTTANFARIDVPFKLVRLIDPVTKVGTHSDVDYESVSTIDGDVLLAKGDVLTVQGDNTGLSEVVTVTTATATSFRATFANPHDQDCLATTANWANWTSSLRTWFVIVTATAANDREVVDAIDRFLLKVQRSVGDWHVVSPTSPGATTFGPFVLDSSPLGEVTVGQLPIVP